MIIVDAEGRVGILLKARQSRSSSTGEKPARKYLVMEDWRALIGQQPAYSYTTTLETSVESRCVKVWREIYPQHFFLSF